MGGASKTSDGRGRATARLALAVLLLAALAPWTAAAATGATAPTALQATPGDGRVVLRWIAPSSDGGSPIDDFPVSVSGGPWLSLGVAAPPAVVAGLTNGIEYSFRIRAVTGAGPGSVCLVKAGGAVTVWDRVESDSTGRAVTATGAGQHNLAGYALDAAAAADEVIRVWLQPHQITI